MKITIHPIATGSHAIAFSPGSVTAIPESVAGPVHAGQSRWARARRWLNTTPAVLHRVTAACVWGCVGIVAVGQWSFATGVIVAVAVSLVLGATLAYLSEPQGTADVLGDPEKDYDWDQWAP